MHKTTRSISELGLLACSAAAVGVLATGVGIYYAGKLLVGAGKHLIQRQSHAAKIDRHQNDPGTIKSRSPHVSNHPPLPPKEDASIIEDIKERSAVPQPKLPDKKPASGVSGPVSDAKASVLPEAIQISPGMGDSFVGRSSFVWRDFSLSDKLESSPGLSWENHDELAPFEVSSFLYPSGQDFFSLVCPDFLSWQVYMLLLPAVTSLGVTTCHPFSTGPGNNFQGRSPPYAVPSRCLVPDIRYPNLWKGGLLMFCEESWLSHDDYIRMLYEADQKHRLEHNGMPIYEEDKVKAEIFLKMLYFDIDDVKGLIGDLYSASEGRPTKTVDKVLRSQYLRIAMKDLSADGKSAKKWPDKVKRDSFLRMLLGCKDKDEVPGLASYYDLANKLWAGDRERYNSKSSFSARKNIYDEKLEIGPDNKAIDKVFKVSTMYHEFMQGNRLTRNDERYDQQLVTLLAVYPSMENGVIPRVHCCGIDSTAWAEHGCKYGKTECDNRMNCPYRAKCGLSATFSAPDGRVGYDSGEKCFYFGESLDIVTCYNRDYGIDLPIFFMLADAERHDSITFFPLMQEFFRNVPGFYADYFLLDGAYDYPEIYELLLENGSIPNISLCDNHRGLEGLPKGFTIDKNGLPCCHDGHPLSLVRNNDETRCWEFQCPLKTGHREGGCPNQCSCKLFKESLPLVINPLANNRLFCCIPRDSEEFRTLSHGRSTCERMNNRTLNNYGLSEYKDRNADHRSLLTALAIINIHVDAWIRMRIKPKNPLAQKLYEQLLVDDKKYKLGLADRFKPSTPPRAEEKVDWEGTISMFRERNRQERYEDRIWKEKVNVAREARRAEKEGFTWQCPSKVAKEKEAKGEGAFDNLPEANPAKTKIPVLPEEKNYVKSWEKTYYDYEPDSVVIDLAEPENKPWKGLVLEEVLITEGRYAGWKLIRWVKAKDVRLPREIREGFIHVRAKVWVRPAAEAVEVTAPMVKTSTVSKAEIMGAKVVNFTKEIYQDPDFRPPSYGLINWNNIQWEGTNCNSEEQVKLYSDPKTAMSQTKPFPKLSPNYSWCRQPTPREFVVMEHARLYGAG